MKELGIFLKDNLLSLSAYVKKSYAEDERTIQVANHIIITSLRIFVPP